MLIGKGVIQLNTTTPEETRCYCDVCTGIPHDALVSTSYRRASYLNLLLLHHTMTYVPWVERLVDVLRRFYISDSVNIHVTCTMSQA